MHAPDGPDIPTAGAAHYYPDGAPAGKSSSIPDHVPHDEALRPRFDDRTDMTFRHITDLTVASARAAAQRHARAA
jgi:hypothetical protein